MTSGQTRNEDGARAPAARPRDAATLVIVDANHNEPRVLFGKRRMDLKFMPGKYVFPGGRVDRGDRLAHTASDLNAMDLEKLMLEMRGRVNEGRARALGVAAIRETFEEAGLLIGEKTSKPPISRSEVWQQFLSHDVLPALSQLHFFARAITPPGRPRRFDTRFFCVDADAIAHTIEDRDGEFLDLQWWTLEQAREFDLPPITRVILEDLGDRIVDGRLHQGARPVPFYHHRNGTFRRDVL